MVKKENTSKKIQQRLDLCLSAGNIAWWEMDCNTGKVIFNKNKVQMLGYKMNDFKDVTYESFTDLVHPDDYEKTMKAMRDHLNGEKPLYEVEYRIKTKKGEYKWFYDRGTIVEKDEHGTPLAVKGIVLDITKRKRYETKLQESYNEMELKVQKRTEELHLVNIQLREEIEERKTAEEYTKRTKEYLRNVIDSASELIIAFDINNRITTWNKTIEELTGYKPIEVLNRSVSKLNVFINPQTVNEIIKETCESSQSVTNDIIIKTKQDKKHILRLISSPIQGKNKECIGAIFIGSDITYDLDLHGTLVPGCNYLLPDSDDQFSMNLLSQLFLKGYTPTYITRSVPSYVKSILPSSTPINTYILSKKTYSEFPSLSSLDDLVSLIQTTIQKEKKSVILLDGFHYILTLYSFASCIEALFKINESISTSNSMFFLQVDTTIINENQRAILQNEFLMPPHQRIDDIIIDDQLTSILQYIYRENMKNAKVSLKKMTKQFHLTYPTITLKVEKLLDKQLIYDKKEGKERNFYITDKGKSFLQKRKSI